MSAKQAWCVLWSFWIRKYAWALDTLQYDARTNFEAAEFRTYAEDLRIGLSSVPTEEHESIGWVLYAHATLRKNYEEFKIALPPESKTYATFPGLQSS